MQILNLLVPPQYLVTIVTVYLFVTIVFAVKFVFIVSAVMSFNFVAISLSVLSVTTVTSIAFAIFPTVTAVTTIADDRPFTLLRFVDSLTLVTIISALASANFNFCVSYAIIVTGVSFVTTIVPFSCCCTYYLCYNFSLYIMLFTFVSFHS